jgi:uroporphyrinogen-III synthase
MMLIVTRPRLDALPLKDRLEARGHAVCLSPLLSIVQYPHARIPVRAYQAVVLTSANSARALVHNEAQARITRLPVITVGVQSAAAAREAGFLTVHSVGGNAAQLVDCVRQRLSAGDGALLYLSGKETSGDIVGSLAAHGFKVDRVVLYEARAIPCLSRETDRVVRTRKADGVLLYSRRTAKVWARCIETGGLAADVGALVHYCLSPQVAAALPGGWITQTAPGADEEALLNCIDAAVEGRQRGEHVG